METATEQLNIVLNSDLIEQIKTIEACIADLKELGLDDDEIKKLEKIIDAIIDNRLDVVLEALHN